MGRRIDPTKSQIGGCFYPKTYYFSHQARFYPPTVPVDLFFADVHLPDAVLQRRNFLLQSRRKPSDSARATCTAALLRRCRSQLAFFVGACTMPPWPHSSAMAATRAAAPCSSSLSSTRRLQIVGAVRNREMRSRRMLVCLLGGDRSRGGEGDGVLLIGLSK